MLLSTLLKEIVLIPSQADCFVARIILDSRQIRAGDLFLAIKGAAHDGREYIPAALKQGAAAVLVDADSDKQAIRYEQSIPLIPVLDLHAKLGLLGARFNHSPSDKLKMFGVTGTNGKTSCTHFIAQLLEALHIPCGVIGTLGSGRYGALGEAGLTTPDAITLQSTLAQFVREDVKAVAMEVSSHSIDQGRINDLAFEVGIFTNLTQDHLDYHGTMLAYKNVKRRFFAEWPLKQLVINADDPVGIEWINDFAPAKSVFAYSVTPKAALGRGLAGFVYAEQVSLSLAGISAHIVSPWGEGQMTIPLIGQFNLSNVLAVFTALCASGIPFNEVMRYLPALKSVPGRMEVVGKKDAPLIVVDYAHTPDALEKVLHALRSHIKGRLICVFGCGGDRDPGKRPLMGNIAETGADLVMVTNDNPRHEDPEEIAKQIFKGFKHPERVLTMLDRSKAIEKSIQLADGSDCILIAGKGAERYQQIGDEKQPFDDVKQAAFYLEKQC